MDNKLKSLRLAKNLTGKDTIAVVQQLYPKYDKTVQSKCENGESYGVDLRQDALQALYSKFAPELLEAKSTRKKERHRLTCRISGRLENADYTVLQQLIQADGYATVQDWITYQVRCYIAHRTIKGASE